jgi:hypothetical protein
MLLCMVTWSSIVVAGLFAVASAGYAQQGTIQNGQGVQLSVAEEDGMPALHLMLPGVPGVAVKVLLPEHVTVTREGGGEGEHLYLYRPGASRERPLWRTVGRSLEYEMDLKEKVHLAARATLEEDGVLFHYELRNGSDVNYQTAVAITDPRMAAPLHDARLERTYVHYNDGFALLGAETPARLTLPLDQWFPVRYLASYTWPVPVQHVEKRADGIRYYNTSRAVDEPLIATVSSDHTWVVASFAKTTGNVWSNPELTCQHVDAAKPLPAGGVGVSEVKVLIFKGTLEQALEKERAQREKLQ